MSRKKIILDCDPGHDDAVAILLAAKHPEISLLGITVVAGNQTLENTQKNALRVAQYLDLDVPVYAGCGRPIVREKVTAGDIHGETGLDGPVFEPLTRKIESTHAVNYIIDTLMHSEEKITMVTTGPMTNLGMALRMEPGIAEKIEEMQRKEEAAKIASETIGPHSVTFRNEAKTTEAEKQIEYKRVVEIYLFGTGLLYRGLGCTC